MRNSDYWANRMRILEESLLDTSYEYVKNLEHQYDVAIKDIESQIAAWYQRFAIDNEITLAEARKLLTKQELAEFRWTVEEYIKYGRENAITQAWTKQLKNASARVHISRLDSLKIHLQQQAETLHKAQQEALNSSLAEVYERGYYHTAFEIQKGFGVGWSLHGLTDTAIHKVLSRPWTADEQTFSNRIWTNKQSLVNTVNTQLTQMIMRGLPPDKAIKAISEKFKVSKSQAGRLVMTESAAFANIARQDCFTDLGVEKYVIVETLDGDTCTLCGQLDGQIFSMKEYKTGVTAPPFHPWCRGTTAPYFDDLEGIGDRFARNAEGKTCHVPASMKYDDWKDTFIDSDLKPVTKSVTIKNKVPFSPASTIKEAEEFARNTLGIQNVSYKGVDIVTANAWNEGLHDSFNRFPELKNNFGFVGEAHERNTMLKPIAKQYYLDELIKMNPSFSITQLEPYADKKIRSLMKSLQVGKSTYAQSWSPTSAPFYEFRGVSVNKEWGRKSADFIESLVDDVISKFHPVGCDTIRSVLDHEIGHQLDDLLGIRNMAKIQNLFDSRSPNELTDALSRYSWKNSNKNKYSEMIAEAWSEYCNNPQPREIAKIIGETIEAEYNKKFEIK